MKFKCCGAAQEVTGSAHVLDVDGKKILLDCGLFQGRRAEAREKNEDFLFDPSEIDVMILTHAHLDHSGKIPYLVKKGFRGTIYATPPTVDLCKLMLKDSAFIQEHDIEWVNKIRKSKGQTPLKPLYTGEDADASMKQFKKVDYDETTEIFPNIKFTFREAGHILGSAGVILEIKDKGRNLRVGFTGDAGRPGLPVIRDPNLLRDLDALILECTYGNKVHDAYEGMESELATIIKKTVSIGGKIIIPAFALGRTQFIVYLLHKLFDQNRIPEIPIYVDSPLAVKTTEVFRKYPEDLDRETNRIYLDEHKDPFLFDRLKYVKDVEESKKLSHIVFPHIIISASGMAEGGRVLHHLQDAIGNKKDLILFVGYAAKHTLARKIMDGEKKVKILGKEFDVRCNITMMDGCSAHGDRKDLLNSVKITPPSKLKNVVLVHGEPDQAVSLKDAIRSQGYENVYYPEPGEEIEI